ncbi:MAG: hypothetical protein J6U54_22010 [Clostridiales bacterium]|nr:hypothetical protein [Clostridiales bacterium]
MIKVIVDTCFLSKFKKGTEISPDFRTLIDEAGFELLVHPYTYENEMGITSRMRKNLEQNNCRVIEYTEFLSSDAFRKYYSGLFIEIYNEFYARLVSCDSIKADKMHRLEEETDVFNIRFSGSSLGDVHIILLALFKNIPIILSEDSDMSMIYSIAKTKINSDSYQLKVYKIVDLVEYIKAKDGKTISNNELKRIRRAYD